MIELIKEPWPWYVAGPLIAVVYTLLALFGKSFGISASLRAACAMAGAGKRIPFFDFDWKSQTWNFMFIIGSIIGGFIASKYMMNGKGMILAESTIESLKGLGLTSYQDGIYPTEVLTFEALFTLRGFIFMVIGGFLIGFGSRWAGGCTSGHAISGLANLQLPSLIAVIGFFIGGLIMTFFFIPIIFNL
tara:strand:+ start:17087 stop:17653 length:567 start_codon:yes stop_codon:yes gene_type:complete